MSFSHQIKFAELSKLLENVSISTVAKKREEYFRDFFKKMIKFRDEFRMKNPNEVIMQIIKKYKELSTDSFCSELFFVADYQINSVTRGKRA